MYYDNLSIFVDKNNRHVLKTTIIDYKNDNKVGGLIIKSREIKKLFTQKSNKLFLQIQNILNKEVNPILKQHNGKITLVKIIENSAIQIKFSGNCHSCGLSTNTLNNNVKLIMKKFFPNIINIYDITNHKKQMHPYY